MTKKEIDRLKIWSKIHTISSGYILLNPESAIKQPKITNNKIKILKIK